jgi:O-antigen/teichoic acid export membrane protein
MSHGQFTVAYETVPLGFLISTPKSLHILLVHKIRETRFQLLLFNWACTLLALLGAGICGFSFMPMLLAVGVVAEGIFLFFLVLCIDAGDLLLDFALEDERFFELATRCHALSVFEDAEFAPPQLVN